MKYLDYHYKHSFIDSKNSIEEAMFVLTNEYGYNFASESKRIVDEENMFLKPKNIVNKQFINTKR